MQITTEQQNHLAGLLTAELQCAKALEAVLKREHDILLSSVPEEITSISSEKQLLMKQLQQQLVQRDRFLLQFSLPPGNPGTDLLLKDQPAETRAATLWKALRELAVALRDQNEINGGIVSLGQRHTKQALQILSGRKSNNDHTYGPEGTQRDGGLSNILAKV